MSLICNMSSPWYGWKIAELALNNNHSYTFTLLLFIALQLLCNVLYHARRKGWNSINFKPPPLFVPVSGQELDFQQCMSLLPLFFCVQYVKSRGVDIGGIVDHHNLNFLLILYNLTILFHSLLMVSSCFLKQKKNKKIITDKNKIVYDLRGLHLRLFYWRVFES